MEKKIIVYKIRPSSKDDGMLGSRTFLLTVFSFMTILIIVFAMNGKDTASIPPTLQQVENILSVKGQMPDGALVLRFPRTDLKVTIGTDEIPCGMAFVSWSAWKERGSQAMVMGDFVLLENEINPFISEIQKGGIMITGLHNHYLGEKPRIMFMHISATGKADSLAKTLKNALAITGTPIPPKPSITTSELLLDTKHIEEIIGSPGQAGNGFFKIVIGRKGVKYMNVDITSSMGLNSWAGFFGTNEKSHVGGDIAMTTKEVNPVIRALRAGGIDIVAIHNHMLSENPRIIFLHYWGSGTADSLAKTVRSAFVIVKNPAKPEADMF